MRRPAGHWRSIPTRLHFPAKWQGGLGEPIDLNLDLLGELHGVIDARMAAGLRVNVGDMYQDLIAQKLAWFRACLGQGARDIDFASFKERRSRRIVPKQTNCQFINAEGELQTAKIMNISCSGAGLALCSPIGHPSVHPSCLAEARGGAV